MPNKSRREINKTVEVRYHLDNEEYISAGILTTLTQHHMVIGHTFDAHGNMIDKTKINKKSILKLKVITPKEINSLIDIQRS